MREYAITVYHTKKCPIAIAFLSVSKEGKEFTCISNTQNNIRVS